MYLKSLVRGAAALTATVLGAACATPQLLEIDHGSRTARLYSGADTSGKADPVSEGDEIRVPSSGSVVVRVTNTNSALYRCAIDATAVPTPEVEALRSFVTQATDYVSAGIAGLARDVLPSAAGALPGDTTPRLAPASLAAAHPDPDPWRALEDELDRAERAAADFTDDDPAARLVVLLAAGDSLVNGPNALRSATLATLAALERMHDAASVPHAAARLRLELGCGARCERLPFLTPLADTLHSMVATRFALVRQQDRWPELARQAVALRRPLGRAVDAVRQAVQRAPQDDHTRAVQARLEQARLAGRRLLVIERIYKERATSDALLEQSRAMIGDADRLLTAGAAAQALARDVSAAATSFACPDPIRVSLSKGRAVKVDVTPKAAAELSRQATSAPYTLKFSAQPRLGIRPVAALAFSYAPDAEFPGYRTSRFGADGAHLPQDLVRVESGESQDHRRQVMLTLGLDVPVGQALGLGTGRQHRRLSRVALFPEVGVQPTDKLRAYAVGGGVAIGSIRLSAGRGHYRHDVLAGQAPGDTVEALRTRAVYGRSMYYGIAWSGLFPFIGR